MTIDELIVEAEALLHNILQQIAVLEGEAQKMGIRARDLKLPDGSWPLAKLLTAEAQALSSLAQFRKEKLTT